jgi:hypothetical protein
MLSEAGRKAKDVVYTCGSGVDSEFDVIDESEDTSSESTDEGETSDAAVVEESATEENSEAGESAVESPEQQEVVNET